MIINHHPNLKPTTIILEALILHQKISYLISVFTKQLKKNQGHLTITALKNVRTFPQNTTIIDYLNSTNVAYKQTNCLKLCYDIYYIKNNPCNCTNTKLGRVWEDCFEKNEKLNLTGCTYLDKVNYFRELTANKCQQYCPLECDSVSYSVQQKSFLIENDMYFYVYFESLKYTSISQTSKLKGFDLFSNVGGILGLFIGVSFVSFFEICELFVEIVFIFFEKNASENIQIKFFG